MSTNKDYDRCNTQNAEFTQQFFIMNNESSQGYYQPEQYQRGHGYSFNHREPKFETFRGGRRSRGRRGRRRKQKNNKNQNWSYQTNRRYENETLSTEDSDRSNSDNQIINKRVKNFQIIVNGETIIDQIRFKPNNNYMFAEAKNMKPPEPHKLASPKLN